MLVRIYFVVFKLVFIIFLVKGNYKLIVLLLYLFGVKKFFIFNILCLLNCNLKEVEKKNCVTYIKKINLRFVVII